MTKPMSIRCARTRRPSPISKKALRQRSVWGEPLLAEAQDWHGLRRFRLRRLWRVNTEALLIAAGQNLKRLLSWRGWGRRPWPGGAPGLHLGHATPPAPRVLHVSWLVLWPLEGGTPPAMPLASRTSVRAA
jgi:Transposase DDE domain